MWYGGDGRWEVSYFVHATQMAYVRDAVRDMNRRHIPITFLSALKYKKPDLVKSTDRWAAMIRNYFVNDGYSQYE